MHYVHSSVPYMVFGSLPKRTRNHKRYKFAYNALFLDIAKSLFVPVFAKGVS